MLKETWNNYRRINRMRLDGVPFADIAVAMDDSEEHVFDFWQRYHIAKQEQKKHWDIEHPQRYIKKQREYRAAHKDEINARARQDRVNNPEKYREWYQRKKNRAEERGVSLNDPEYRRQYYLANQQRLIEYSRQYVKDHYDQVAERAKQYYLENRERILKYHVEYYQKKKCSKIEQLILSGVLPEDYEIETILSSYAIRVKQLLDENSIQYVTEKRYPDCRDVKTLPFDFYLINSDILIEVDGEQHFYPINFGGQHQSAEDTYAQFQTTIKHDQIKTQYAKDHDIPLIRVPYYLFENENWGSLLLEEIQYFDKQHNKVA